MFSKAAKIFTVLLLSTVATFADVQTKQTTSDYFAENSLKKLKTEVVLVVSDISGGTGKCSILSRDSNTAVGLTIVADTVWMGDGSSKTGDLSGAMYQTKLTGCLTETNRVLQSTKIYIENSEAIQEIVTFEFESNLNKVKNIKVEFKFVASERIYESMRIDL